ncbi:unnamed protein product [Diplocarpon coronariae]
MDEDAQQRANGLYYLVDWDDNAITGESYPIVDWVRYSKVTVDAVAAWRKSWQKQPASESPSSQPSQSQEPEPESNLYALRNVGGLCLRRRLLRRRLGVQQSRKLRPKGKLSHSLRSQIATTTNTTKVFR